MASVVVCGGSMIGLLSALMLGRDGHDVVVLDADPAAPPPPGAEAWDGWGRRGVAQFHQPHNLMPGFRRVVDEAIPGLTDRLEAAGCVWIDPIENLPPTIDQTRRPGDDRFRFVTGRRPVVESVVAAVAAEHPGIALRRGVKAAGLVTGPSAQPGVPHVTGVVTAEGERLDADLVVDAMGRRSPGLEWLDAIGAPPPATESTECGFAYYTRYFTGPHQPKQVAPFLCRYSNFSVLTLPGDNDTWSVTLFAATGDAPLKEFRRNEVLQRVVAACPLNAHWLDGTPITDVVAMAGILDKYRRFVVDDEPVVTGYAAVGDAWACTNPSAGRGMSVGAIQAAALRDVARGYLEDPVGFALRYDAETQRQVAPYFFDQLADDRFRIAQLTAARDGTPPPTPDEGAQRFFTAVMQDATVFRAMLDSVFCLATRGEVLARPDVAERVAAAEPNGGPQLPGPDRAQLLDLIAG